MAGGEEKAMHQAAWGVGGEGGGKPSGILADGLEKTAMNREHRNLLIDGQLVLISPYDPSAGFNVGHAMQRNKLIYALADASLIVSSDINKGGTWSGAIEQLDKLRLVPVYVRSTGEDSEGLDALRKKGAIPWPNPRDANQFDRVFDAIMPSDPTATRTGLSLFSSDDEPAPAPSTPDKAVPDAKHVPVYAREPSPPFITGFEHPEGVVEKQKKPVGYKVKQSRLFR